MTNSRAGKEMQKLNEFVASGTGTTNTYSPDPLLLGTKYQKIVVVIDGSSTAALAMQMEFNSLTSNYKYQQTLNDSGTLTAADITAGTELDICPITLIDIARGFHITVELYIHELGYIYYEIKSMTGGEGHYVARGYNSTSTQTDISEIIIQVSTSSWAAGTRITTYGVLR